MRYEIVLRGRLGDTINSLLKPESVDVGADSTRMVIDLRDDAAVYAVVDRLGRLGMGIISFAQESARAEDAGAVACGAE